MEYYALNKEQAQLVSKTMDYISGFAGEETKAIAAGVQVAISNPINEPPTTKELALAGIDSIFFASGDKVKKTIKLKNQQAGFLN